MEEEGGVENILIKRKGGPKMGTLNKEPRLFLDVYEVDSSGIIGDNAM